MILTVEEVVAGYGEIEVLHGISLGIREGELACIIGPNGSGKSTLFRVIMGFVSPWEGRIIFQNSEISGMRPHQVMREGVTCVLQGRTAFAEMTVLENLELGGYTISRDKPRFRRGLQRVFEQFPVLRDKRAMRADQLSGGEQQMLEMGRALMLDPKLLLLDEPTLGLAPKMSALVFDKIKELNQRGLTVVIIEQNAQRALEIADRAFVLDLGRIRMEDEGFKVLSSPEVRKLYLGAA